MNEQRRIVIDMSECRNHKPTGNDTSAAAAQARGPARHSVSPMSDAASQRSLSHAARQSNKNFMYALSVLHDTVSVKLPAPQVQLHGTTTARILYIDVAAHVTLERTSCSLLLE